MEQDKVIHRNLIIINGDERPADAAANNFIAAATMKQIILTQTILQAAIIWPVLRNKAALKRK